MTICSEALLWYKKRYGNINAPTYTSKFYQPFESWPKRSVWWPQIPTDVVEENLSGYINILCQVTPNGNDFYYLRVPARFLHEHLKEFHFVGKIMSLYLSADPKTLFIEDRDGSNLDFGQFLVNK